jgi:hypothetical protein
VFVYDGSLLAKGHAVPTNIRDALAVLGRRDPQEQRLLLKDAARWNISLVLLHELTFHLLFWQNDRNLEFCERAEPRYASIVRETNNAIPNVLVEFDCVSEHPSLMHSNKT